MIFEDNMSVNVTFFSLNGYLESMWGGFKSFPSIFSGSVVDIIKPNTTNCRVFKVTPKLVLFFHAFLFLVSLSPIFINFIIGLSLLRYSSRFNYDWYLLVVMKLVIIYIQQSQWKVIDQIKCNYMEISFNEFIFALNILQRHK